MIGYWKTHVGISTVDRAGSPLFESVKRGGWLQQGETAIYSYHDRGIEEAREEIAYVVSPWSVKAGTRLVELTGSRASLEAVGVLLLEGPREHIHLSDEGLVPNRWGGLRRVFLRVVNVPQSERL